MGGCLPALGDAKRGRFQYEDRRCLNGNGENVLEDDEDDDDETPDGCVSAGESPCRFCLTEHGRSGFGEEEDEGGGQSGGGDEFDTCPRDVCKVHDLRWKQCEPS